MYIYIYRIEDMKTLRNIWLLLGILCAVQKSESSTREALLSNLFANYEPSARPAAKGVRIDLHIAITLHHIGYMPADGSFEFVGHLNVHWIDPKLKWKPSDYENLTRLAVSQKMVWVPDLEMYDNVPDKMFHMHQNGMVTLSYDGNMCWDDSININTFCVSNMDNYPFDSHSCRLSFGSWTYEALEVDIVNKRLNASMNFDNISGPSMAYRITNFTAMHVSTTYSCCSAEYVTIDYYIDFEHRSNLNVIFRVTAFCVVVLGLLVASEHMELQRKLSLSGIAYFLLVLHILYFATLLGRFSRTVPAIVKFYLCSMVVLTFTVIASVLAVALSRAHVRVSIPIGLYNVLHKSGFVLPSVEHNLPVELKPTDSSTAQYDERYESENNLRSLISFSGRMRVVFCAQRICFYAAALLYALLTALFQV